MHRRVQGQIRVLGHRLPNHPHRPLPQLLRVLPWSWHDATLSWNQTLHQTRGDSNSDGHLDLVRWAGQFDEVVFALEDCRHLTRRLRLICSGAGCRVVRVTTRLMAGARRAAREPGKSDPIDAEAVALALAALRDRDPPVAELDGPAREVKLLSDHHRALVVQRTRIASQVAGICTNWIPTWWVFVSGAATALPGRPPGRRDRTVCRGGGAANPGATAPLRAVEPADRRIRGGTAGDSARVGAVPAGDSRRRSAVRGSRNRGDRRGAPVP